MKLSNTFSHLYCAAGLSVMLLFAVGSGKPKGSSNADGGQPSAKAVAARKVYDDYVTLMGAAYGKIAALDKKALAEKPCNEAAMLAKAPPGKNDYGRLPVERLYGPFMARFAKPADKSAWKDDRGGPWAFLTDDVYRGHFIHHADERDSYSLSDTSKRITEEFAPHRFVIVTWPDDEALNRLPAINASTKTFSTGLFKGSLFVVDIVEDKIECQGRLFVENTESVTSRSGGRGLGKLLNVAPEVAVRDDFEDNFEATMKRLVPAKLKFAGMGSLLR